MKKILITQTDSSYFLNETLSLLERHALSLRNSEVTIFCQQDAVEKLTHFGLPKSKLVSDINLIADEEFDLWFNLSISNFDKNLLELINSPLKKGPFLSTDDWSHFLLTIKEKSLYLNLHLQDIYAGVLGLPRMLINKGHQKTKRIIFGHFQPQMMCFQELTNLTTNLKKSYPLIEFQTIDEVDYLESHQDSLYFGPATLEAIKLSESGAKCIFVGRYFTGMNLIPYQEECLYITTHGESINATRIEPFIHYALSPQVKLPQTGYSLYQTELIDGGLVFNSLNQSDYQYASYQAFFILWSYLLGFSEVRLNYTYLNKMYAQQFKNLYDCLDKVSQLNRYALFNAQTISQELAKDESSTKVIQESNWKIQDIEKSLDQFSAHQLWFNPLYRFFHYKFQQLDPNQIIKSSEERYILYAEIQQTIEALKELFAVTLTQNEVSIE